MESNLSRAMAYLDKLPIAQSGAGGHNATLQAALACRRFGLTNADMWEAMQWFNEFRCSPSWSEKELRHKVTSVVDMPVKKPLGSAGKGNRPRAFVAPEPVERKTAPSVPVIRQSAQAEELWWAQQGIVMGTTLEEFDRRCGNV